MMGFDTLILGGFVTYVVIKYVENTWKAEPMDLEELETTIEQHREGRAMLKEKNREYNRVRRDLKTARRLKEIDDELEDGLEELKKLGYDKEESVSMSVNREIKKERATPPSSRRPPVKKMEEEEEEEVGASIHLYSKPTKPIKQPIHPRKKVMK